MELLSIVLAICLAAFIALSVFLAIRLKKASQIKHEYTTDAKKLLRDICSGSTTLQITVLDQGSLFLRSPRDL